jgi:hypothetical protein
MNKSADIILMCIEDTHINQTILAKRMGMDRRALNQMLRRGNTLKQERFEEMLECMGYSMKVEKTDVYRLNKSLFDETDINTPMRCWCERGDHYAALRDGEKKFFIDKEEMLAWLTEKNPENNP